MINQEKLWDREYITKENLWSKETKLLPSIFKNKSVLELGVGNGKTIISIIKQNPKKLEAIDFSQNAINICKDKFSKEKANFKKADVLSLPYKDLEFDIVVCYYLLNNLTEKQRIKAVEEIYRVTKSKGIVLFEDFMAGDFRQIKTKEIEKNTIIKKNNLLAHFFTINELKVLFNKFSRVSLREITSKPIKTNQNIVRKILQGTIKK